MRILASFSQEVYFLAPFFLELNSQNPCPFELFFKDVVNPLTVKSYYL